MISNSESESDDVSVCVFGVGDGGVDPNVCSTFSMDEFDEDKDGIGEDSGDGVRFVGDGGTITVLVLLLVARDTGMDG